jgi:hypothetical protein
MQKVLEGHEKLLIELEKIGELQKRTDAEIDKLRESQKKTDLQLVKVFGEIRESQTRTDAEIDKLRESQKKTDNQMKKTDVEIDKLRESQKKTDEQMSRTDMEIDKLRESQKRTDSQLVKFFSQMRQTQSKRDEEMDKLRELVKELSANIGGVNNSIGKIPEYMTIPEVEKEFERFDIRISEVRPDVRIRYEGGARTKEIDAILVGKFKEEEDIVIVIETKLRFRKTKEVDRFYEFLQEEFKEIASSYRSYKVVGCISAIGYGEGVESYAERRGLFVMKPVKGVIGIVNKPSFKFRSW